MIFLWNQERVLAEVLELARLRISERLNIPPQLVFVGVQLDQGVIKPAFQVNHKDAPEVTTELVQQTIRDTWLELKNELSARLASIWMVRHGATAKP